MHPWDAADVDASTIDAAVALPHIIAIGETGLDKACDVPFDVQMRCFEHHIDVSERHALPLVIHCVRAFDDIIAARRLRRPSMPWIIHGFARSADLAERLVSEGFHLSFGGALLRPHAKAREALQRVPVDRVLLETDDDADLRIADVHVAAADLLHVPFDELCTILQANFEAVFKR